MWFATTTHFNDHPSPAIHQRSLLQLPSIEQPKFHQVNARFLERVNWKCTQLSSAMRLHYQLANRVMSLGTILKVPDLELAKVRHNLGMLQRSLRQLDQSLQAELDGLRPALITRFAQW